MSLEAKPKSDASIGELMAQLSSQLSRLVRDEMRLAQKEFQQSAKHAGAGAGLLSTAGLLAFFGVASLIAAANRRRRAGIAGVGGRTDRRRCTADSVRFGGAVQQEASRRGHPRCAANHGQHEEGHPGSEGRQPWPDLSRDRTPASATSNPTSSAPAASSATPSTRCRPKSTARRPLPSRPSPSSLRLPT